MWTAALSQENTNFLIISSATLGLNEDLILRSAVLLMTFMSSANSAWVMPLAGELVFLACRGDATVLRQRKPVPYAGESSVAPP